MNDPFRIKKFPAIQTVFCRILLTSENDSKFKLQLIKQCLYFDIETYFQLVESSIFDVVATDSSISELKQVVSILNGLNDDFDVWRVIRSRKMTSRMTLNS